MPITNWMFKFGSTSFPIEILLSQFVTLWPFCLQKIQVWSFLVLVLTCIGELMHGFCFLFFYDWFNSIISFIMTIHWFDRLTNVFIVCMSGTTLKVDLLCLWSLRIIMKSKYNCLIFFIKFEGIRKFWSNRHDIIIW